MHSSRVGNHACIHHGSKERRAAQSRKFPISQSKCQRNANHQNLNNRNWMVDVSTKCFTKFEEIEPPS
jgi:hypothetical protein